MNPLEIISFLLWIYLLTVFKRAKTDYFYYLFGCIGLFVFMMLTIQPIVTKALMVVVTSVSGLIGKATRIFSAYQEYNILFIKSNNHHDAISLYIDYECSGVIEMLAYVSLLAFFQVYDVLQRIIISILGCICIFAFNIIRICSICAMIYFGGNDMYYLAHTVWGRIIFYFLSVILYYYTFTHTQIVKQKIGGFGYTQHS